MISEISLLLPANQRLNFPGKREENQNHWRIEKSNETGWKKVELNNWVRREGGTMGGRDPLSPMENFPYLLEHVSTWIDTRIYTSLCKEEHGAEPWPNSRVNAKLKHRLFVEAGIHSVLSVTPFIHRWNSRMETTKRLRLCGQLELPLFSRRMENSNFSRRDSGWKRWKNNEWLLSNGIISESR